MGIAASDLKVRRWIRYTQHRLVGDQASSDGICEAQLHKTLVGNRGGWAITVGVKVSKAAKDGIILTSQGMEARWWAVGPWAQGVVRQRDASLA